MGEAVSTDASSAPACFCGAPEMHGRAKVPPAIVDIPCCFGSQLRVSPPQHAFAPVNDRSMIRARRDLRPAWNPGSVGSFDKSCFVGTFDGHQKPAFGSLAEAPLHIGVRHGLYMIVEETGATSLSAPSSPRQPVCADAELRRPSSARPCVLDSGPRREIAESSEVPPGLTEAVAMNQLQVPPSISSARSDSREPSLGITTGVLMDDVPASATSSSPRSDVQESSLGITPGILVENMPASASTSVSRPAVQAPVMGIGEVVVLSEFPAADGVSNPHSGAQAASVGIGEPVIMRELLVPAHADSEVEPGRDDGGDVCGGQTDTLRTVVGESSCEFSTSCPSEGSDQLSSVIPPVTQACE